MQYLDPEKSERETNPSANEAEKKGAQPSDPVPEVNPSDKAVKTDKGRPFSFAAEPLRVKFAECVYEASSPAQAFESLVALLPLPEQLKDLKFPGKHLEIGARLEALSALDSDLRLDFVRTITQAILSKGRFSTRMKGELHKTLLFLTREEKTKLARELLAIAQDEPKKTTAAHLLGFVLQSSKDFLELSHIVKRLGTFNLLDLKDTALRECAALVHIGWKLRKIGNPRALNKNSTARPTNEKLGEIRDLMYSRIEAVKADHRFARTQVAKRFLNAAEHNLEYLADMRTRLKTVKDRRHLANMLIDKNKLETRYNLALTNESDVNGRFLTQWRQKDIKDATALFSKFNEGLILFTSRFGQIRLMEQLQEGTYGQRDGTGLLKLSAEESIDNKIVSSAYYNVSSLKAVLCHEIWHSIKFGAFADKVKHSTHIDQITKDTNPRAQFADFVELSEWRVVDPSRYTVRRGKHSVKLDGVITDIDRSVKLDGYHQELQYDEENKILYSYRSGAQFSEDPYCRANPWEDFAEAGTEYMLQSRRLTRRAPWKFLHFEQFTRNYQKDPKKIEALYKQLVEES